MDDAEGVPVVTAPPIVIAPDHLGAGLKGRTGAQWVNRVNPARPTPPYSGERPVISRGIVAPRTVSGNARIQLRQKSLRCAADRFHVLFLSAPSRGLVAVSDTHRDSEKEQSWVTRDGSNMTQNRAIAT